VRAHFIAVLLPLLLSGCALSPTGTPTAESTPAAGPVIRGVMHGGQQPITSGKTYLLAVNSTGYGGSGIAASSSNASVSLLSPSAPGYTGGLSGPDGIGYYVLTDSNGNFNITNDYACTAGQQLYLYGEGGDSGAGANNAKIGLMAALGECSTINSSTYVVMNEVSTVATAYALAGFATDATHISSSGTALAKQGVSNAMANVGFLETLGTGAALLNDLISGTIAPQETVNSLANILASCVNTDGSMNPGSGCNSLLTTATSNGTNGGTQPGDTATAAIYIAQNAGANVSALYNLPVPTPPFSPVLSGTPTDWTVDILFAAQTIAPNAVTTGSLAIDRYGDVVVAGQWPGLFSNPCAGNPPPPGCGTGYLCPSSTTQLSSYSEAIFVPIPSAEPVADLSGCLPGTPSGVIFNSVAFDGASNLWVTSDTDQLVEINQQYLHTEGGGSVSLFSGGGMDLPQGLAFDASGNLWVANSGPSTINAYNPTGASWLSPSGISGGGLQLQTDYPSGVAIDTSGNVWAGGWFNVSEFSSTGNPLSGPSGYADFSIITAGMVAINQQNNAWVASSGGLYELSPTGTVSPSSPLAAGGTLAAAVDGAGNIWMDSGGLTPGIAEVNASGTLLLAGAGGYSASATGNSSGTTAGSVNNVGTMASSPFSLAIDGSGNVWVFVPTFNYFDSPVLGYHAPPDYGVYEQGNAIIEVVGAATPVVTPIVANLMPPYGTPASKP